RTKPALILEALRSSHAARVHHNQRRYRSTVPLTGSGHSPNTRSNSVRVAAFRFKHWGNSPGPKLRPVISSARSSFSLRMVLDGIPLRLPHDVGDPPVGREQHHVLSPVDVREEDPIAMYKWSNVPIGTWRFG